MEGIKFYKKPRLKDAYLIVAWPGMGEVAFKSASYLVEKLSAEVFAEIEPAGFFYFTGSVIQSGVLSMPELPYSRFYYWKNKSGKNDLVVFLSNAQPDLAKADEYCKEILAVAKHFRVKRIISLAAMPQPIDHMKTPNVWFAGTSPAINAELKKYNFTLLSEGQISGMNGLFLGIAKKEGLPGFCLLGEIPLYTIHIENPKASYALLNVVCLLLNIRIDFTSLIDQSHLMEEEINKLLDYIRPDSPLSNPIGQDEIDRIKKSLSQLTKLPVSVKERIEKLFEQAKTDISKANELKIELDKWSAYKEYEDRFLDLFKKIKEKGN